MDQTPTPRSRLLGQKLRRHREAAGLTVEELAERTRIAPHRIRGLEEGVTAPHPPDLHCAWGEEATAVLDRLCRTAVRIDTFAPFGLPALDGLDPDRCTAYVPEGTPITRADVTTRSVPAGVGSGFERPVTLFHLPDGTSVVFYPYPHAAFLTEAPDEVEATRAIFGRLHDLSSAATA